MNNKEEHMIKCPHCGESFTVSETAYNALVKQIRDEEFTKQLEQEKETALKMQRLNSENELTEKLALLEKEMTQKMAEKERKIEQLKNQLDNSSTEAELSKTKLEQEYKSRVSDLENELKQAKLQTDLAVEKATSDQKELLASKELSITKLQADLDAKDKEKELSESSLKETYENLLKAKDEEVKFYKDFKAKQSTKAIGEDLEIFCSNEFEKVRSIAYPNAYFDKDNEVSKASGSKGDFIFRDYDEDGVEYVSIMFECKNEADTTDEKSRHTNASFFKELDKDRKEKGCEYAVLVSMLERDNDYYNVGIQDVSARSGYKKMFVVRPQFFMQMIGLLRNAAKNSLSYKKELVQIRDQNVDITNFENKLLAFQSDVSRNAELANKKFDGAIDEIDKAIANLQKVKDNLLGTERQIGLVDKKVNDMTIRKLTYGNPTMQQKFAEAKKKEEESNK